MSGPRSAFWLTNPRRSQSDHKPGGPIHLGNQTLVGVNTQCRNRASDDEAPARIRAPIKSPRLTPSMVIQVLAPESVAQEGNPRS
jgi:hypothetical protein